MAVLFVNDTKSRLEQYENLKLRIEDIEICDSFSDRKNSLSFYDCIIIPADSFIELSENNPFLAKTIPFLPYGSADSLFSAFLWNAEDYLKDPWDIQELQIRLKKIKKPESKKLEFKGYILTPFKLHNNEKSIELKPTEYSILKLLFENKRKIVDRLSLQFFCTTQNRNISRVADVHISHIRKKIRKIRNKENQTIKILSIRNKGYTLI